MKFLIISFKKNKDKVKLPIKLKAKKFNYLGLDVNKVNKIKIKYTNQNDFKKINKLI